MKPVRIAWNRFAAVPVDQPFSAELSPGEFASAVAGAKSNPHPTFEISPGAILEIPPPTWGHGEFLIYLTERNWMVRRNYTDYWYIDIGISKPYQDNIWGWTDLWLDVILPESADRYRVLDADEFAQALRSGEVCTENGSLAMDSLSALLSEIEQGRFPPAEVRLAEEIYNSRSPPDRPPASPEHPDPGGIAGA